ncbi:MAG: hypothetical protein ACRDIU_08975, partial [Actinomycetota bacterium]
MADLASSTCAVKTGSGSQAGSVSANAGDAISITATGMNTSAYSILYTDPAFTATSNCHLASAGGVTSMLGYNTGGSPNTVMGPDFSVGTYSSMMLGGPAVYIPAGSSSGTAKICTQDEPNRVTGNQLSITILGGDPGSQGPLLVVPGSDDHPPEGQFQSGPSGGIFEQEKKSRAGYERHHMPARSATGRHPNCTPAILMEIDDHRNTASFGNTPGASSYRLRQKGLIGAGRFDDAMQMDIDDVRGKFGSKYDEAILQAIDSI